MGRALGLLLFVAAGVTSGCRQAEVAAGQLHAEADAPGTPQAASSRFAASEQRLMPYLVAHGRAREDLRATH